MVIEEKIQWHNLFSVKSMIFRILGVVCAALAFKGFMLPNHFLDGGINGISILLHEIFHINISVILIILNLPFLVIGYQKIGKTFAVSSLIAIILLAVLLYFIEMPAVTDDKFLIAIFGGIFMGLAIGFVIRSGGVVDGLEVIAEYTNLNSAFSTGEIIMAINSFIFLCAAYKFGIETAMYSTVTYFTALQVSNYVVDGFEEFTAMTIVSKKDDEVKDMIINKYNKAITVYKGVRGHLPNGLQNHKDTDIIVTIITRLEIFHLRNAIKDLDPEAFIFVQSINEVSGGIVKRESHH